MNWLIHSGILTTDKPEYVVTDPFGFAGFTKNPGNIVLFILSVEQGLKFSAVFRIAHLRD